MQAGWDFTVELDLSSRARPARAAKRAPDHGTKRKKIPREGREGACPIAPNQRWSLDFNSDALANGRKFRTANLKDDCTRECPAIEVDFSLPGERVVEMLERVARERGYPDILVVDNSPELRGRALDGWAEDHGAQLYFIDPFAGKTAPHAVF